MAQFIEKFERHDDLDLDATERPKWPNAIHDYRVGRRAPPPPAPVRTFGPSGAGCGLSAEYDNEREIIDLRRPAGLRIYTSMDVLIDSPLTPLSARRAYTWQGLDRRAA